MQTSHRMNRNNIRQSRLLRKRRTSEFLLCYNFTPCLNSFSHNKEKVNKQCQSLIPWSKQIWPWYVKFEIQLWQRIKTEFNIPINFQTIKMKGRLIKKSPIKREHTHTWECVCFVRHEGVCYIVLLTWRWGRLQTRHTAKQCITLPSLQIEDWEYHAHFFWSGSVDLVPVCMWGRTGGGRSAHCWCMCAYVAVCMRASFRTKKTLVIQKTI